MKGMKEGLLRVPEDVVKGTKFIKYRQDPYPWSPDTKRARVPHTGTLFFNRAKGQYRGRGKGWTYI